MESRTERKVEEIVDKVFCREIKTSRAVDDIIQAILSDPSICKIEVDAELPLLPAKEQHLQVGGIQTARDMQIIDAQAKWMCDNDWVKKKEDE